MVLKYSLLAIFILFSIALGAPILFNHMSPWLAWIGIISLIFTLILFIHSKLKS